MTPQEALSLANALEKQDSNRPVIRQWLAEAAARDILAFIHGLSVGWNDRHMPAARASLDVRLAEDAAKQSDALQQQVSALKKIAEEQRLLAVKLEGLTKHIIYLTWGLLFLTAALLVHEVIREHSFAAPHSVQTETDAPNAEPVPKG
jgi:hypothetical protein